MSKYSKLWEYVASREGDSFMLSFEDIGEIAGVPVDHSFLRYKSELGEYGWRVGKISMKVGKVEFLRV